MIFCHVDGLHGAVCLRDIIRTREYEILPKPFEPRLYKSFDINAPEHFQMLQVEWALYHHVHRTQNVERLLRTASFVQLGLIILLMTDVEVLNLFVIAGLGLLFVTLVLTIGGVVVCDAYRIYGMHHFHKQIDELMGTGWQMHEVYMAGLLAVFPNWVRFFDRLKEKGHLRLYTLPAKAETPDM